MNIEHFITFQRLAREKNFSGTAETLGISQPTVTLRIKEIEETVGKLLFYRLGQHIALTEAGESFLAYVNRALRVLERGKEIVGSDQSTVKYRLATTSSISSYLLPQFLQHWYQINPNARINIYSDQTQDVLHMVRDDVVDAGIVRGTAFDSPLESVTLYHDPICLVVGPSNDLLQQIPLNLPISIRQLKKHPIIAYKSHAFEQVNKAFLSQGMIPNIVAELPHIITVKKFVQSGAGIAFLPYSTIKPELLNGQLFILEVIETSNIHYPTQVIYNRLAKSANLDKLIHVLKSYTKDFPGMNI